MPELPSPPGDHAARALPDIVGQSRPRTPHDGSDPDVPVAATVVIARDSADGPEVLLIERPDRGSFAGAWVFPGGKLEPGDADAPDEHERDVARRTARRETLEETGLRLESGALETISCWDPPPGLALRIRTWFFLAPAPARAELALAVDEAVSAQWARPSDILRRHGRGELTLYPPTWVTLHSLADQPDVAALRDGVRLAGVQRFETVARRGASGPILLWEGDAEYDVDAPRAGARHRLEVGALPWLYTRSD